MRWQAFLPWLCEVEHLPAEGWASHLLERCDMEHPVAIHRLLDRVAEFVSTVPHRALGPG